MTEVVASVRRVTDIVGEISSASQEQSAGIAEVGRAITQMDEGTQQNAALVEQAAAAAQSLQDQAATLAGLVGGFHIDGSHARMAQTAPVAPRAPVPAPKAAAPKPAAPKPAAPKAAAPKPAAAKAEAPASKAAGGKSPSRLPAGEDEGDWETF
jgi:methyl-accepting chemotaxis protein